MLLGHGADMLTEELLKAAHNDGTRLNGHKNVLEDNDPRREIELSLWWLRRRIDKQCFVKLEDRGSHVFVEL